MPAKEFPAELWLRIIQHLPWDSLHAVKHVNSMLHEVTLERLLAVLDLAPRNATRFKLETFKRRIELARSNPTAVKVLQVSPDFTQLPNIGEKSLGSLFSSIKFFFPSNTKEAVKNLDSLIPRFVNVQKFSVIDRPKSNSKPMITSIRTWWGFLSSKLTVLVLQLSTKSSLWRCLPRGDCPLPLLQTFRLHARSRDIANSFRDISNLLSDSPLLEEIEWSFVETQSSPESIMVVFPYLSSHPKLRVFKWSTAEGPGPIMLSFASSFCESMEMYFSRAVTDFASQLEVIHLCPCPLQDHGSIWRSLDFTKLTEIRADLSFCRPTQLLDLFNNLGGALCLEILELDGCYPLTEERSQHAISLLPQIPSLKELYLPIGTDIFGPDAMKQLAQRAPNLVKLVLHMEEPAPKLPALKITKMNSLIPAFESATPFEEAWSLRDLGVMKNGEKISDFGKLVNAVAKIFPSIGSFYGSGKRE
ncbi:hypothetical protein DL96DRAFT_1822267, partial [Flagelloscypha sp. PMI_526]